MENITYRGIEIGTDKNRAGEVWLQTRTKEAAQAYADASGDVVMSHLHTIGWVEATVEEIKEQIDEMMGDTEEGEVVPAPADEGSEAEMAEIQEQIDWTLGGQSKLVLDDESLDMAMAMEYAGEMDAQSAAMKPTDERPRHQHRSLKGVMRDVQQRRQVKTYEGTWSKDPVTGDWLAHIQDANVKPGDLVVLTTRAGTKSTRTVDRIVANGRGGGWRCSVR